MKNSKEALLPDRECALLIGLKKYSGLPCIRCDQTSRYAKSNHCVNCARLRTAQYHRAHPDRIRAAKARWVRDNQTAVKRAQKNWYAQNRDAARARQKEHYRANLEAHRRAGRERYYENRERQIANSRRWRENNPERVRILAAARRIREVAKKVGVSTDVTADSLQDLWREQGRKCRYCGSSDRPSVDHKVPLSRGGLNVQDNIQWLCLSCNCRKHAFTDEEFKAAFLQPKTE